MTKSEKLLVKSERVDEFVDIPSTQAKVLIISEHRDSLLAEAILRKHPELANKSESLTRSRSAFIKSRSSSQKSPRHKKDEQNIEIHVSATPPPKQREQLGGKMQESISGEVDIGTTYSVPDTDTRREESVISRRLFDDACTHDITSSDGHETISAVFDGSQMHNYQSKPTKEETQHLFDSVKTHAKESTIPGRSIMTRTSSASSIDEVLQHPGVRKLQKSMIPSPSSRSPSSLGRKRLESPSSSPDLRPSLLPRPGSFTLKSPGSSRVSTPVAAAMVEEEKFKQKPLSASDEYFSKPIPSSIAAPTPPPSTDNVTLRPRRRVFFSSDQDEESFLEELAPTPTYLGQLVPEETQTLHIKATPEEGSCSSPLNHEAALPQFPDYTSDEVDDLSQLTVGSDQVESDTERDRRRLNDNDPRSESGDESVRGNDDNEWNHHHLSDNDPQLENGIESDHGDADLLERSGDISAFPDGWKLDEGPRYQFDLEDEIGNRLSDTEENDVCGDGNERIAPDSKMEEHEHAETSRKEHLSVLCDLEEEDQTEGKPDIHQDALQALLSVRDEMARLRAITRKEESECDVEQYTPASHTYGSLSPTEPSSQDLPAKRDVQPWDDPNRTESSYLRRLKDADRFARSPLSAPPADMQSKENIFHERLSQPQTFDPAVTYDAALENSKAHDDLDLQPSPRGQPEQITTNTINDKHNEEPVDLVEEFLPAKILSPHVESDLPVPQDTTQYEDTSFNHEELEHAGRFDAAEKLFAKETPPPYGYYDRPQSPDPELYMHSEPYQKRLPPTQMGAILNPVLIPTEDTVQGGQGETPSPEQQETNTPQPVQTSFDPREPTSPVECTPEVTPLKSESVRPVSQSPETVLHRTAPVATLGWARSIGITIVMFIAAVFCMAGIWRAAKTVRESHEYHQALKTRINTFEASIAESHQKVLKLEEDYAIWSEYVRKLTEEDEVNALRQLEAIQLEVQKWQEDMKADLVQFRQALSVDSIEAAFADLRANDTKQIE
ncbi:unnamed protein product [Phytophthora fragariaefolia]|uniref:Unnamed protein product n=1 Tax=Phytophthora fragariaefolia TaxID=1490495 RepID=A0A9W6XE72_9STRA|nr:unnamed protein product [Phytophthora fragariaefolia]